MVTQSSYIISWLVVFLLVGAIWYVVDRRVGVRVYRWLYDMTHKDPLPADVERGFIYQRKAEARFTAATALSILQSILAVLGGNVNPLIELITFFIEVPVLMVGFYLGPFVYGLWERKAKILDKMDKLESGEISVGDEIKDASQKAADVVREVFTHDDDEEGVPEAEPDSTSPASPSEEAPEQKDEPDPREMMNRYLRKGQGGGRDTDRE